MKDVALKTVLKNSKCVVCGEYFIYHKPTEMKKLKIDFDELKELCPKCLKTVDISLHVFGELLKRERFKYKNVI